MNNSDKLQITADKIDTFKITKVKNWAVYFEYDGSKYLLHEASEDFETSTTLYYRRQLNGMGKYDLVPIGHCYGIPAVMCYGRKYWHSGKPYNDIDIKKFVFKLTYNGTVGGMYENEVFFRKRTITTLEELKKGLDKEIQKLREGE